VRGEPDLDDSHTELRCYFVSVCEFVEPNPKPNESDIRKVSDKTFLEKVSPNTLEIYSEVMSITLERTGPVIECFEVEGTRERRLVIGYKQGTSKRFFSALSDLYHWYGIYSTRKYVEQFSNGITVRPCLVSAVLTDLTLP
jgi:glutamate dehydrogenase